MQKVPNDGSYFLGDCDGDRCNRSGTLVRRLKLDKAKEGAQVYLCETDWKLEMKSRFWHNKQGVAEPWKVYGFYDPEPDTPEAKEVEIIKVVYPTINFTIRDQELSSKKHFDVWITFRNMNDVVVSTPYAAHVDYANIGVSIKDARKHMFNTRRIYGMITILPSIKHFKKDEQGAIQRMFREINFTMFDALEISEAKEVMKYV